MAGLPDTRFLTLNPHKALNPAARAGYDLRISSVVDSVASVSTSSRVYSPSCARCPSSCATPPWLRKHKAVNACKISWWMWPCLTCQ